MGLAPEDLDGPTLDYIREKLGRLRVERKGKAVRIVAGTEDGDVFYWGFSALEARNMGTDLIEESNAIMPIRCLC